MLELANNLDSSPGPSRTANNQRQRDSVASSASTTENNRRFGLAAIAASRKGSAGAGTPISRFTTNLSQQLIAPTPEPAETIPVKQTQQRGAAEPVAETAVAAAVAAERATQRAASAAAAAAPAPAPSTSALTSQETARSERAKIGLAAISASRRSAYQVANRVQNGQSLSALRDTSSGVQQFSSGITQPDGGRRSTSLFDLPSSGQGLVTRLRAQVRPSSPLNALRSSAGDATPPSSGLQSLSLTSVNSQRSALNSSFRSHDNSSRSLLSASNPNRTAGGFGLTALNRSAFDLIG